MERKLILDRLKKLRESGIEIGVPLNATTERLRQVDRRLFAPGYLNPDLIGLWLTKLSLDSIYRLYLLNANVRKLVNKSSFWEQLIRRDLGLVPKFNIDLRLYYLREEGIRVLGPAWVLKSHFGHRTSDYFDKHNYALVSTSKKVVHLFPGGGYLTRDGNYNERGLVIQPPTGERFKEIFYYRPSKYSYDNALILLTYSGKFVDAQGRMIRLKRITQTNIIQYRVFDVGTYILTREGQVYQYVDNQTKLVAIPEPIITLSDNYALSETGKLYRLFSDEAFFRSLTHGVKEMSGFGQNTCYIQQDETISKLDLPQPSLPVISLFGFHQRWGVIDNHLKVWIQKNTSREVEEYPIEGVIQVPDKYHFRTIF